MNVKFFLDTADLAEIEEAASWGALAGVTTNPTQDYDYQAEFAGDEKFLVSFFRESRADQFNFYTPYETTGKLTGKW